jgi:hypothetical protein
MPIKLPDNMTEISHVWTHVTPYFLASKCVVAKNFRRSFELATTSPKFWPLQNSLPSHSRQDGQVIPSFYEIVRFVAILSTTVWPYTEPVNPALSTCHISLNYFKIILSSSPTFSGVSLFSGIQPKLCANFLHSSACYIPCPYLFLNWITASAIVRLWMCNK